MSKKSPTEHTTPDNKPDSLDRRKLLTRGGIAAGGLATFATGYGDTLSNAIRGLASGTAGKATADAVRGNSLQPEFLSD